MQSITRRSILKSGVALTATAAAGIINTLHAEPLVSAPGIQLYTVDKELQADVEGTLKKVREIGYREVETAGLAGYSPQQFRAALANISEEVLLPFSPDRLKRLDMNSLPLVAGEPRVGRVGKFICIGSASTEVRR
jgi:hypothetical protein